MINSLEQTDIALVEKNIEIAKLFETEPDPIPLEILKTEEFQKMGKQEWVVATFDDKNSKIIIKSLEDSGRTRDEWLKVIIHEMVHWYFIKKFHDNKPTWFFEGIACYISGQKKKDMDISITDLLRHTSTVDKDTYNIGYNAVKRILENERKKSL